MLNYFILILLLFLVIRKLTAVKLVCLVNNKLYEGKNIIMKNYLLHLIIVKKMKKETLKGTYLIVKN